GAGRLSGQRRWDFLRAARHATRMGANGTVVEREPGRLYAFPQQILYSLGISSIGLGIARSMLEVSIELACRGRLADNAAIQTEVARAEAKLGAARAYLIDTVIEICMRAGSV